ncbi:alpha-galactosidase [Arachidicoccus rhizosphaerae]|uniref:Alpha-galactosidase n=1 Tax=Arachidicoccus rhizosphaerae TaxID=551991 RepID=A0A1H3WIT9_9BACT|nr:glycoside hydrolase family 27 protein [Arachidicoccus rhizosphaerae]SDZ86721.1 alpha-galactosidase [Arachidicoccus rhizosphaerae]
MKKSQNRSLFKKNKIFATDCNFKKKLLERNYQNYITIPLVLIFSFFAIKSHAQKFNQLALTPPMGWNSWNTFQTHINEDLIKKTADNIVSTGMKEAGYIYLVLDDGWMTKQRDSLGYLVPDPEKFPHGIKAVIDYVHSKGLKFGLYNCAGTLTCAGYPGTRGHEYQDALRYAQWGIDYLKYDWCSSDGINAKEAYTTMSRAISNAGRPMVFSLCEWGSNQPWLWAENVGQLWRTTADITAERWDGKVDKGSYFQFSPMAIMDSQEALYPYAGPGHYNDPDMLEVGNGNYTPEENRSHFSMWAMMAAPLMAGNDLSKMTPSILNILTNKNIISIDQDSLAIQGHRIENLPDSVEVWAKPLKNNQWAVAFLNRGSKTSSLQYTWSEKVISDTVHHKILDLRNTNYPLQDLWLDKQIGTTKKTLKVSLPAHDVLLIKIFTHH